MTVSYNHDIATVTHTGFFWKLFKRYRGSVLKLVLLDYIVFLLAYFALSVIYRFILPEDRKRVFEGLVIFCRSVPTSPVTFILGFYVNVVYRRWWDQLKSIPWPDNVAIFLNANIRGKDDRARMFRRNIIRYVNASYILCLIRICSRVKKRFPTKQHLVDAGVLDVKEKELLEAYEEDQPYSSQFFPLIWATDVADTANKEGRLGTGAPHQSIIKAITEFRVGLQILNCYDRFSFPLLYSQ
ncbi:unnamed protein product, partial [Cyprideis torosa]